VSAGWGTSCALTPSGTAYCWGGDTYGQLGDRSTTGTSTPVPVTGGLTFVSTGVGVLSACGLTAAGAAYCWGNNSVGQLGIGAASPETCGGGQEPCSSVPVAVSGGLTFTALSVGYFHACGLTSDGSAYCWGDNGNGQLGATTTEGCVLSDGTVPCSTSPVPVEGGLTFAKLSAGYFHSCGVTAAGDGYCWGANDQDQLGNGTATSGATPAPIAGGLTFTALSAFGRYHSCGLSTASIAYCWGSNYWGQVGAGTGSSTPVPVIGQAAATAPAPARTAQTSRAGARIAVPRISARPPRP
jgi:alpha-tubulin suppressor-like RCC1 family protein